MSRFVGQMKPAKFIPVTAGIITLRGKILLIRRSRISNWPGMWEVPRGKCDKQNIDKSIYDCLRREVKEECGLDIQIVRYIGTFAYVADKGKRESIQYNFLCTPKRMNQKIVLNPKEHDDHKWVSTSGEIEVLGLTKELKETIYEALDIRTSNVSTPKKDIKTYLDKIQEE